MKNAGRNGNQTMNRLKSIDTLKVKIKVKEKEINDRVNEANEKAKKAIEELNSAKTKAENLLKENTKLIKEKGQLSTRLTLAKNLHPYHAI